MAPRRVTLLTDFGTRDGYAAALRGVLASRAPQVLVEDASHEIDPGDIAAAGWTLSRYWRLYPPGTIHVVVVDPGVGGARRALAVRVDDRFLLAPDNGVLTRVLADAGAFHCVSIEHPHNASEGISATFHGRDIFAPAAARLANDRTIETLGPLVTDPVRLPLPQPRSTAGRVTGEVVHVDRFGNLITNVPAGLVEPVAVVHVGSVCVGAVRRTYGDVGEGEPLALIGSAGLLEVAVRSGSAAAVLGTGRGVEVEVVNAVE